MGAVPARRKFLRRLAYVGAAALGGCEQDRPARQAAPGAPAPTDIPPERVHCDDVAGLSKDDVERRKTLRYTDRAQDPARTCGQCAHLQPVPGSESPCKRCSVVAGPVHVSGWCTAWAARPEGPA